MQKQQIITVVNTVSPTSMPINEFLLYRRKNYGEEGSVLTISPIKSEHNELFKNLKVLPFKKNRKEFMSYLWNNSDKILHLHQPKSALLVTIITLLMPRRFKRITTVHNNFEKFKMEVRITILFNAFFSDQITFVGQSSYDSLPSFFKKLLKHKCSPITNGVDISRVDEFLADKEIKEKNNTKVELIYIGKLHKQKNHEYLVNLMSKLSDQYHLTIVGEGEDRGKITEEINRLDLMDRITITGIIPREKVYELLLSSDIFVSTALWEGMPIGVLEAMSCYLPVVLSKIPPHMEIQSKSATNFICNSTQDYLNMIEKLSALSSKERLQIGKSSRKTVEENFILSIMHTKYDKVYSELSS